MKRLLLITAFTFLLPLRAESIIITTKDGARHNWPNWYETKSSICTATPDGTTCINKKKILKLKKPKRKRAERKKVMVPAPEKKSSRPRLKRNAAGQGGPGASPDEQSVQIEERLEDIEVRLENMERLLRDIEILLLEPPPE
jgi:hypothetical protein